MKNKVSDKKILILIISLLAAIIFLIVNWFVKQKFTYIIETNHNINQCYDAKITNIGDIVILDSGHNRILVIDKDSFVKKLIAPDGYVDNIVLSDDDSIWTQESYWDGMWISDEFIVNYKDGIRHEFFHYNYKDVISKHKIHGLTIQDDRVIYALADFDKIRLITHVAGIITTRYILFDNAFNSVSDVCINGENVYILDKSGKVYKSQFANDYDLELIYNISESGTDISRVPYKLTVDDDENVYFTDIRNNSVQKINNDVKNTTTTIIKDTTTSTISIHKIAGQNTYLLSETDKLIIKTGDNEKIVKKLHFNGVSRLYRVISFISFFLSILSAIIFVITISIVALSRLSTTRLLIAITMVLSIIVSGLLMYMLLNKFTNTYAENINNQLEISAYVVANRLNPDDVSVIRNPSDYTSDSYKRISAIMEESFPLNVDFNKNVYCNILKINDYNEPCAIAYLDQSIGVYYPLDDVEKEEVKTVYETKNAIWNDAKEDISGTYFYVKVPVSDDSGEVRACVAVGCPLEVLTNEITRIRHDILASSIVILLLLFITITEVSKILDYKSIYDKEMQSGIHAFPGHKFMLLIILVFAGYNMSSTFLPIFIIRRLPEININKELLASLPITINIFIIGLMSLFCSRIIKIIGVKYALSFSVIFSIIGNIIIFFRPTYYCIFLGLILDGIGVGIITNTCYVIITFLQDEVMKMEGFTIYNASCLSGINIGMLLGSIIAVNCDYNYVFLFVIAVWLIVMFAANSLYKTIKLVINDSSDNYIVNKSSIGFGEFISSGKVNLFFILMQNPAIIFNSFIYYFLPIYCDNHGYSATIVSIFFIVYTEVAVLSGSALLKYLSNRFGNNTMYIGFFTNIAAVFIYGLLENTTGLIISLSLLGFSAGFLKPALQNYFISLKKVDEYGEDNALGIYNFTENIGESLGPTIFSLLMATSPVLISIIPFSTAISGMGFLHMLVNKVKKEDRI